MTTRGVQCLRFALGLVCLVVTSPLLRAQAPSADERDALAAVQTFFDAMATCDADKGRSVSVPEGRLYRLTPGATEPMRSSTFEEFNTSLGKCGRRMLERMWQPQVRVHKGIANVWTPYDFWLDGKFSHCGIDSFELMKSPAGWKLTGGSYTVERDGCAPSPLGTPVFTTEVR